MIMDLIFEAERMPNLDESLDASSLSYKSGGKGSNTAVAIYRAQHKNPNAQKSSEPLNGNSSPGNSKTQRQNHSERTADAGQDVEVAVYINTTVGDDAFGRQLKKSLQQNDVDVTGVRTSTKEQTGTCAVFVEEGTGNSPYIGYPGANTNWTPRQQDSVECLARGNTPDLIVSHLETKRETIESVLATASAHGVDTLLNPSPVFYLLSSVY
jgi:ribokinase